VAFKGLALRLASLVLIGSGAMNLFVGLPAPAGIGAGAATDVSLLAATKTIVYAATPGVVVVVDISNDVGATKWTPVATLNHTGETTIAIVARWMRARVIAFVGSVAPSIEVGAENGPAIFATLTVPPGNGIGAAIDVSTLEAFKTAQVGGALDGELRIEVSQDGVEFAPVYLFSSPSQQSQIVVARFARVQRFGVHGSLPVPVVTLGAAPLGTGVNAAVNIEDEGVPLPNNPYQTLDFVGIGVTASDAGGGVAQIDIPGLTVEDEGISLGAFTTMNFVGPGVTATDDGGGVTRVAIPGGGATLGAILFWGVDTIGAAADSRFLPPGHDNGLAVTTNIYRMVMPRAAVLRNLFVRHNSAGGNGNGVTYTVLVNGVATALTVTLATGAVGQAGDTTHSVAVVQGDTISLRATKALVIAAGNLDLMATLEAA
jgi:hypothetical protein